VIEKLEEFNQYLVIAGFKNIKISNVDAFVKKIKANTQNACVQFFDAKLIAGPEHLRLAAVNSLYAFRKKVNISSSLAMETLLYASAQNQISNAIKMLGIKSNSGRVAVVIMAHSRDKALWLLNAVTKFMLGKRDDSVIELNDKKVSRLRKFFQISSLELEAKTESEGAQKEALLDLVIEHMALLATKH
jgi:tRNA threonylcarbamoyladenosine modification (KEOPS) complex Cgi121 subunit